MKAFRLSDSLYGILQENFPTRILDIHGRSKMSTKSYTLLLIKFLRWIDFTSKEWKKVIGKSNFIV